MFNRPWGIATDRDANLYVADSGNNRIRKVTRAGLATTVAGSGQAGFADGEASSAMFNNPVGVAVDSSGAIFVGDQQNARVRRIGTDGTGSTFAGSGVRGHASGQADRATFNFPGGLALDGAGNLYVADAPRRIRKITPAAVVTTLAGGTATGYFDGRFDVAQFNSPTGLAVDAVGNIYVADQANARVRLIAIGGFVSTVAGPSYAVRGGFASFQFPIGVAIGRANVLYMVDRGTHAIYTIGVAP